MKIVHSIGVASAGLLMELEKIGLHLDEGASTFKIAESDERWLDVAILVEKYDAFNTCTTTFTKAEFRQATAFFMTGAWQHGYPEPSDDFGYLEKTYKFSNDYCSTCNVGKEQKGSFYFAKEPNWGNKGILELNWIFDELFVLPNVWENIFKPFGIDCRPVKHYKTGKQLANVVQLVIDNISENPIDTTKLKFEICPSCKRKKYLPITRGFFPPFVKRLDVPILKSNEYFGSGSRAWRAIIVNKAVYNKVTENKIKGVKFVPMKSI